MVDLESPRIKSIHYTLMIGLALLITIQILREGVRENYYYRLGYRPLVIGIAGDSGVGKSTFSNGLATIFGERSTVEVSGDDYHLWNRSSPMWKTATHLDPKANQLFQLVKDVQCLTSGGSVQTKTYNHINGYFQPGIIRKSTDVILVEGLHILYPQQLLEELDVRLFMEMEESLTLFLRMKRDVDERGHTEEVVRKEMGRRKSDSERYIRPQAASSDVVFTLLSVNPESLEDRSIGSNLKVRVCIRNGIYYNELVRILIGICGLNVNIDSIDGRGKVVLEVSGDAASEDVSLAVKILMPDMEELLDFGADFSGGVLGVMQIITLMEVDVALKRRRKV